MSRPASPPARSPTRSRRAASLTSAALLLAGAAASTASAAPVLWNTGTGANGNAYELVSDPASRFDTRDGGGCRIDSHRRIDCDECEYN